MSPSLLTRRTFAARTSLALAAHAAAVSARSADQTDGSIMAYVGTFSSPLRDTLPTQVDLPPGNGRGIARRAGSDLGNFWVDITRATLYVLLPLSLALALLLV